MIRPAWAFAVAVALFSLPVADAPATARQPAEPALTETARGEVIEALGIALGESYVFPEVAKSLSNKLDDRLQSGAYDTQTAPGDFAQLLTDDLRTIGNDGHFRVRYDPGFVARAPAEEGPPSEDEVAHMRQLAARNAYGLQRVERLPGNVGYIDVRGFLPTHYVAPAYEGAMKLLTGSDAIIVDLRSNGGGDPESVTRLMSHFFPVGTELLVNSIYNRPEDTTREFWLDPAVETRFSGPVYVLTSDRTFSGGEEFAYDMKTHQRGRVIGETTGGGANPGGVVPLANGFVAFIPTGRAINPVTGTNWEGTGVVPDVAVGAEQALATALAMALDQLSKDSDEEERKQRLADLARQVRNGDVALPEWKHPKRR